MANQASKQKSKLILSVDLDMWWHCRWATGGPDSIWPDTKSLLKDVYGSDRPSPELISFTRSVLDLFDRLELKSTFFILGQVADWFPELVKEIASRGHEISSHGWHHMDATILGREKFREEVGNSKKLLEDLSGKPVLGYRAPNLMLADWVFQEIGDLGFVYDSSICPARSFFGKYSQFSYLDNNPFNLHEAGLAPTPLFEIPIPAMPLLKLPAASGIITRILGGWWSRLALAQSFIKGHAMYYFHPYEIAPKPALPRQNWYIRLFCRNMGASYLNTLTGMLRWAKKYGVITAGQAYREFEQETPVERN